MKKTKIKVARIILHSLIYTFFYYEIYDESGNLNIEYHVSKTDLDVLDPVSSDNFNMIVSRETFQYLLKVPFSSLPCEVDFTFKILTGGCDCPRSNLFCAYGRK